jgi:hypothetical protein
VTDLLYGGNERGIAAASSYYTGQYGSAKAVTNDQLLETLETNRYLRTRAEFIVANAPLETFGSLIVATGIDYSYNGAGVTFKALPPNQGGNGVADPAYYITELGGGRIYFTSGDQNGNFNIGTGLTINQATGTLVGQLTGTWLPSLSATTNGTTLGHTVKLGNYIKTGQQVIANFSVALSSLGTASGNVYLDGLPFPVATGTGVYGSLKCFRYANLDSKVVDVTGGSENSPGAFTIYHTKNNAAGVTENLTVTELTTTSQLYGTITYISN